MRVVRRVDLVKRVLWDPELEVVCIEAEDGVMAKIGISFEKSSGRSFKSQLSASLAQRRVNFERKIVRI